jgi:hypothetical protein
VKKKSENVVGGKVEELKALKSKRPFPWGIVCAVVVFLAILGLLGFYAYSNSQGKPNGSATITQEKVNRSLTGKSVEDDKKDALDSLTRLLNEASTNEGNYQDRARQIESGDYSSLPEGWKDKVSAPTDQDKASAWEALIVLNANMKEFFKNNGELKPVSDSALNHVVVNQEAGVAHIPGSVFLGSDVPMSFDMVYVDGRWVLDPFNLVQDILQSAASAQQATNTQQQK